MACGDDDGGSGGGITSSVDESKAANKLTPAEEQEVCEATSDYLKRSLPATEFCKIAGIEAYGNELGANQSAPKAEESCVAATADCIKADAPDSGIKCDEAEPLPKECDASVGEMTLCLEAVIDKQAQLWRMVNFPDCEGVLEFVTSEEAQNVGEMLEFSPQDLPACKALSSACTEVFSGSEEAL
ncbi:MAG: hypothetical protein RJA70_3943 [Pseudomonadota bacterium]